VAGKTWENPKTFVKTQKRHGEKCEKMKNIREEKRRKKKRKKEKILCNPLSLQTITKSQDEEIQL